MIPPTQLEIKMPLNPLKDKRIGPILRRWRQNDSFRHRRVCNLGFKTNVEALVVYIHENPGTSSTSALNYLYAASGRLGERPAGWGSWYFSRIRGFGGMGGIHWKKGPGHRGGWTLTTRGQELFENL